MKRIRLTHDLSAIVDDEDYDRVTQFTWYAVSSGRPSGQTTLYVRGMRSEGTRCADGQKRLTQLAHVVLKLPRDAGLRVNYKNGNPLDCRKENLRLFNGHVFFNPTINRRRPFGVWVCADGHKFFLGYWPSASWARQAAEAGTKVARGMRGKGLSRVAIHLRLKLAVGLEA